MKSVIDWEKAKALRYQGLSFPAIARELGANQITLRSHFARHGWCQTARDSKVIVEREKPKPASVQVKVKAEQWASEILEIGDRYIKALKKRDPNSLKLKDLQMCAEILDKVDKVGRRSLGLDDGAATIQIGIVNEINEVFDRAEKAVEITQ